MSNFFMSDYNLESYSQELGELDHRYLAHVDIDYFYAQVEIIKKPELKGLPLIVGNPDARNTGRGVVLTCTYEARKFGVRSGLPMATALQLCPEAIIVKSHRKEYSEISKRIMEILKNYNLPMRKAGSDEAYLDVSKIINHPNTISIDLLNFAKKIKKDILNQEKLTVSVGMGPTLKIAKIASDYRKPDGITIIHHERIQELFIGLPLIKIPGIGIKTSEKLEKKGLKICDDLIYKSKAELIELLGSWGDYIYRIFRGKTSNRILPRGDRKSISHERTFIGKPDEKEKYIEIINKLFESTYNAFIKTEFTTKTVNLKIRFNGFHTITRAKSVSTMTRERNLLYQITLELVMPYLEDKRGIRLLGIGFSNLKKIDKSQRRLDEWF